MKRSKQPDFRDSQVLGHDGGYLIVCDAAGKLWCVDVTAGTAKPVTFPGKGK